MNRRQALQGSFYAAALFGVPATKAVAATALPDESLFRKDPETWWRKVREEQFLMPGGRAFLNNGSLGVAPKPVIAAVTDYLNRAASLEVDGYPRWGYETLDEYRTELSEFLGCKKDELALMHNATEAMSTVAAGLDLKAGDEVLITDQEHPSGRSGWLQRQARHGIPVREVKLPVPAKSPEQLTDVVVSAFGPRTRVVSFSGITSPTGLILPARQICAAARAKGIISVVDGAHMHGQCAVKISDIGCDFFAGSPHKWLFAPAGSGFLYLREEMQDQLWPAIVTGAWDNKEMRAARFMRLGTNNRAIIEGLMAGLRFHKQTGSERIFGRIHQLAKMAYAKARAVPYLEMVSPEDDRMYAGLVTFRIRKPNLAPLWELCKKRKIWTTEGERLRLSTHIHTRPADLDSFFGTLREALE